MPEKYEDIPSKEKIGETNKNQKETGSRAGSFVDQFAIRASKPINNDYGKNIAGDINQSPNSKALWEFVHELNNTRVVKEPKTYEELKADPGALELYVEDAATRQSYFREQAVSARIQGKVKQESNNALRPIYEDEAELHDLVAVEAGRGAVEQYRQMESGIMPGRNEGLQKFLEDHYVEACGLKKQLEDEQKVVDSGKEPPPGAPKDLYEMYLLKTKTLAEQERERARVDFEGVYGSAAGVEALVRRKSILESEAWAERKKILESAANPGWKFWARGRIVAETTDRANNARGKAYQAGDAAAEKFKNFQAAN